MPSGTSGILDRRSLADSHRQLASLLRPGMKVLDVGCATGAITSGIAEVVGLSGMAVGTDINHPLLTQAHARRLSQPRLHFAQADVYDMPFTRAFDIVTAARVVQWLARPAQAVAAMSRAVRPGGVLLVLDYDHEAIEWAPQPPASMMRFYSAFLDWRARAGLDNRIARALPSHFASAGVADIAVSPQFEATVRTDTDFATRAGIWAEVAAIRGPQMVADGFVSEAERSAAEADYRAWVQADAQSMTLHLHAVQGVVT
jgi:SAM-dependent methyltransferase